MEKAFWLSLNFGAQWPGLRPLMSSQIGKLQMSMGPFKDNLK